MKLDDTMKKLIETMQYLTLATVDAHGDPWITPLFYTFDSDYQFYWYSRHSAEHSLNLLHHPTVAISIYDQNMTDKNATGLYMKGIVQEVPPVDVEKVAELYVTRSYPGETEIRNEFLNMTADFKDAAPLRFYRFTAQHAWALGESKFWNNKWLDYRKEL